MSESNKVAGLDGARAIGLCQVSLSAVCKQLGIVGVKDSYFVVEPVVVVSHAPNFVEVDRVNPRRVVPVHMCTF